MLPVEKGTNGREAGGSGAKGLCVYSDRSGVERQRQRNGLAEG